MSTKDGYTRSDREKMDRGESLIPEGVHGIWVTKDRVVHLRELIREKKYQEALQVIDEFLVIDGGFLG